MYSLAVEQAMNLEKLENGDLPHVKLSLEWDAPAKSQIIGKISLLIPKFEPLVDLEIQCFSR